MYTFLDKYPLFLSDFNPSWIFSTVFRKIIEVSNVTKIRLVGAQLRTGGRTLRSNSRSFANAPENVVVFS
jgi:hypothetical protein